ncbi:MAG: response regulator [Thermoanaerobaculia bacterium]|nr:response regulator [Thermoanaerobaculia bacterium]
MTNSENSAPVASILLVEDDESVRHVLGKALLRRGYRVLEASNGARAFEMIEQGETVDVVVTDVVMPEMGGFELAARLRRRETAVRVLLISGYTRSDGALQGNPLLPAGTYFLRKPFSTDLLDEMLRQMLADPP